MRAHERESRTDAAAWLQRTFVYNKHFVLNIYDYTRRPFIQLILTSSRLFPRVIIYAGNNENK
jgi:hypothetical protein